MFTLPDANEHPLLEGKILAFVRTECDGEMEISAIHLVRFIGGIIIDILGVQGGPQDIIIDDLCDLLDTVVRGHGIGEVVTVRSMPRVGSFLGFSSFINLDERHNIGSCNPRSPKFRGSIQHWVRYSGLLSPDSTDWKREVQERGIEILAYNIVTKTLHEVPPEN